jgi:predicted enzyme related to lactoylglutathione lyase
MAEMTARLDHVGLAVADLGAAAALRAGYGHVAFAVADLDAAYDHAVARGARPVMPPCPAPEPGVRMAFVADPEGNLIELLDRGRKQWIAEAVAGRVRPGAGAR